MGGSSLNLILSCAFINHFDNFPLAKARLDPNVGRKQSRDFVVFEFFVAFGWVCVSPSTISSG